MLKRRILPRVAELVLRQMLPQRHYAASFDEIVSVALRTANDSITRVTPLTIMLTPTSVPIAQAELDGHFSLPTMKDSASGQHKR